MAKIKSLLEQLPTEDKDTVEWYIKKLIEEIYILKEELARAQQVINEVIGESNHTK